jgi:hypothetical protein
MTAEEILRAVSDRIMTKKMFGDVDNKSPAEIEEEAITEVAAELKLQPKSIKQSSSEAATPTKAHSVDTQTKIDADWVRARLMEPLNVEIGDLHEYDDARLRAFLKERGLL